MKNCYTRAHGEKESDDNRSLTDQKGNVLITDSLLIEKLSHFNRERIPERVVHAKGFGAFGEFVVTDSLQDITLAKCFGEVGKKTPIFMRFSTVGGGRDSADTARDPRGFAIKLYTDDGILDIVGNNTPVFFINDPIKFPDFIHSQKKNPVTNLVDYDAFWDFLSLTPESIHQATILFSDRGTPYGFRHMHGFGTNTFAFYKNETDYVFVKIHFLTNQGIKNFTAREATEMAGTNPDFAGEDLYKAICQKNYPSWTMYVQIMTPKEAEMYRFDPFDTTKVWFHKDYPLRQVGRLTLNQVPDNFFQYSEQAAFSPSNMVVGIAPSPDKMLQGRMFAYRDAQMYRLGVNLQTIPVNSSTSPVFNYQRDGHFANNPPGQINYYPNSFEEVHFDPQAAPPKMEAMGVIARHNKEITAIDFYQAGELYRRVLTEQERRNLISNICGSLKNAEKRIQYRQTTQFYKADSDYGTRVAESLGLNVTQIAKMSKMTQKEIDCLTRRTQ